MMQKLARRVIHVVEFLIRDKKGELRELEFLVRWIVLGAAIFAVIVAVIPMERPVFWPTWGDSALWFLSGFNVAAFIGLSLDDS